MSLHRFLSVLSIAACFGLSNVKADEVYAVIDTAPPTENLAINFEHGGDTGGWGWYYLDGATRRDIAQSFEAPSGGSFDKVTLKVRGLRGGAITDQPYRLQILEADSNNVNLSDARALASYQSTISMDPGTDFYITFNLPKPVETQAGSYYIVVLAWENGAPSNHLEFAVQHDYPLGSLWQNTSEGAPEFTRLTDSSRPGLIFYVH